jgi:transcriptional regulator with XRE-family HTH domain
VSVPERQPSERHDEDQARAGLLITQARVRAGISQRELARRAGMPGPVVNAIERSRRQPSVPTMAKLLRGLGLRLSLDVEPVDRSDVSSRHLTEAERRRAHEVYNALDLADRIKRSKVQERPRGLR